MSKLVLGIIYGVVAQVITFLQLQGNIKWNLYSKYPILTLILSVPISWCFIKSVESLVSAFGGELWPSRLIGFAIGVIVFGLMSYILFKEPITIKTLVCLVLGCCILGVQIFWK